MSVPSAVIECDLDEDGTFETDISDYVKTFKVGFGRKSILDKAQPRQLNGLILDNSDSRFSPDNASSPYNQSGKTWEQGQRIRVKVQVPTAAVTNLCENPSAETDVVGWAGSSPARDTTRARFGKACVKIVGDATSQSVYIEKRDFNKIAVTTGLPYAWRVWVYATGGPSDWKPRIRWFESDDTPISTTEGSVVTVTQDGAWLEIVVTGTAPALAAKAQPQLLEDDYSFTTGETLYLDGAYFYQGDDATLPYCDGDVPGSTWSGTAHESTSSRSANPTFTKFQGRITSIKLVRYQGDDPVHRCTVSAISDLDRFLDRQMIFGNMTEKPGDQVINAVLDRAATGDIIDSKGGEWAGLWPEISDWTAYGGTTDSILEKSDATVAAEGDWFRYYRDDAQLIYANSGAELDLSSKVGAGEAWKVSLFILNPHYQAGDYGGNDVTVKLVDSGGTLASTVVTVPSVLGEVVYVELSATWTPAGTGRKLQIEHNTQVNLIYLGVGWDSVCVVPEKGYIQRDLRLGSGETAYATLAHVASFYRSSRAFLDDVVASIGGVLWEKGDGSFVVEDYKTRLDSPIPVIRFTDAAELDGIVMPRTVYARDEDHTYSRVTAISDGDISGGEMVTEPVWALEPAGITLAADEERRFYARYLADASGPLIVEGPELFTSLSAGSLHANSGVVNMGVGGVIRLIAGGSGATIDAVYVMAYSYQNPRGRVRQRGSHRSRVSKGDDSGRELEIDMPCQGDDTTAMNEVAQQALDLLASGRETMVLPFIAGTPLEWLYAAGAEISTPIWLRHNTGAGNFALDEAYYVEGGELSMVGGSGSLLSLNLYADKAA